MANKEPPAVVDLDSLLPSEREALPPTRPNGAGVPFYRLPDEWLMVVLSYSSDGESMRRAIRLIDRYCCYRLSHDDGFWKQICVRAGLGEAVKSFDVKLWEECKSSRLWPCRSAFEWLYWSERPRVVLACGIAYSRNKQENMIGIGRRTIERNDVGGKSIVAGEWLGKVAHGYGREVFQWLPSAGPTATSSHVPKSYEGPFVVGVRHNGILRYIRAVMSNAVKNFRVVFRVRGTFRAEKAQHQLVPFGEVTYLWDGGTRSTEILMDGDDAHWCMTDVFPDGTVRRRLAHENEPVWRHIERRSDGSKLENHTIRGVQHHVDIRSNGYRFSGTADHAKIRYEEGSQYEGQVKDRKRHGIGRHVLPSGDIYSGKFVDGRTDGQFVVEYKSGARFEGMLNDFERSGAGKLTNADGTIIEGTFEDNNTLSLGTIQFTDGRRYTGPIKDVDVPHGYGNVKLADGTVIHSEFEHGEPVVGLVRWPDGKVYTGAISNWKPAKNEGSDEPSAKKQKTAEGAEP